MEAVSGQGRLIAIGLCAELVLVVSFFGAHHLGGEAQGVALAVTLAAALISLVVGALVDGCALTLLFSVPSLIFLVLLKGLLFVAM